MLRMTTVMVLVLVTVMAIMTVVVMATLTMILITITLTMLSLVADHRVVRRTERSETLSLSAGPQDLTWLGNGVFWLTGCSDKPHACLHILKEI